MSEMQEALLWVAVAIAPVGKVHCYDPRDGTFYTVEAYKKDTDPNYAWSDKERGLDIRKWGRNTPYEQTCVRYRLDVLQPLRGWRRSVERYDGFGNEIWDEFD